MAFVYKRGKIYYVGYRVSAVDDNGNTIRKQVCEPVSPDRRAAEEFCARKTLNEYAARGKTLKRDIPIQEFYEEYRKNHSVKNKRDSTIKRDDIVWKTFKEICPNVKFADQFDDAALNEYMHKRLKQRKIDGKLLRKASINRDMHLLKHLAKWGYKNRYLSSNYYDLVDNFSENDSQKKRAFTDDEIQKIIDNTQYPQREAHILSIWHGMRAGEICALECSDFVWARNPNIERDYIKVRNKSHLGRFVKTSHSERDIPIHPMWRDHLYKVWLKAKEKSNFFLVTYLNQPISPSGLTSSTRKLFDRLQLTKYEVSFHSGRHTYATRIKDGGGSLYMASKSLGHSNTRITEEVYTDFKPHEHFNVVDFIKIDVKKPKINDI
ncbi:MAG: tyrosine-type recombinase/integrase [Endomicrobium sp.]|jgi:integrase|nr:tyrosine-type recombinase/integrase [Endomicrobium sp.]